MHWRPRSLNHPGGKKMQDGKVKTPCRTCPEQILHKDVFKTETFNLKKETSVFKPATAIAALMACSAPAVAATDYPSAKMHTALPGEALTVTDWYKQNVYDPNENKIGDIKDVLVTWCGQSRNQLLNLLGASSV